jgi:hypothetical protein
MPALAELQDAAGIAHVVWVDDVFAEAPEEALRVAIHAKLKVLYDNGQAPRHQALSRVSASAPEPVRNRQVEAALDAISDKLPRLLESLTKQAKDCGLDSNPEEDLSPAQVVALRDGLRNVRACPYRTWKAERESILQAADETTLFLIDREFVKEGLGEELGDDIIADIVSAAPKAHCIMFTHKVAPESVDDLRAEIGRKVAALEAHQFGVMSKRGLGGGVTDVTPHFSRSLRMALLCRFCCEVAIEACDAMNRAAVDAAHTMARFSVESIDAAIFENSLTEGASEFDVVERILAVNQRCASQRALATNRESFKRLQRLRDVRALEPVTTNGMRSVSEPQLHAWRVAEVLDEGGYINALHSPLCCGDVFQHTCNQKRYVLLAQPCDLVVRGKRGADFGKRRRDEAELVLIEEKEPGESKREANFVIAGVGAHGESWLVNFREAFSVNLRVLDLAVYNREGRVEWRVGQKPPIHLLPGWKQRFQLAEKKLGNGQDPDAMETLSHCDEDQELCGDFVNATYTFPLARIRRIRSPYAEAIQASFAAFLSRAALSHDFARSLWPDRPEGGGE